MQASGTTGKWLQIRVGQEEGYWLDQPEWLSVLSRVWDEREAQDATVRQHSRTSGVAGCEVESAARAVAAQILGAITLR